jgi:glycosyltransferase involved in cell wall biosynthesis
MSITFTIITPSFQQGSFLEETILSVLNQDYPNIEYMVIDGGSTDNSSEIIEKYRSRLHYAVSEKDKGQTDAINKGLSRASGKYIMWLNSDDVLLPGAISRVVELFEANPEVDLIHGHALLFGNGFTEKEIGKDPGDLIHRYAAYIPFPQPSSFFTKRLIDQSGPLDEALHYGMDYELLVRAFLNGKILYDPHMYSRYRLHVNSKTNQHLAFTREWNFVFAAFLNSFPEGEIWKKTLSENKLLPENTKRYQHHLALDGKALKTITMHHLNVLMHYHYRSGDHATTLRIAKLIQQKDPSFFEKEHLGKIAFRAKYIPPFLLKFFRKGGEG